MVARGRHHATRAGLSIVLEVAPVEALPFPDRTFDVVLSSLMLHHLPEDVRGLAFVEIRRVLCPGGRLLAVDFESPRSRIARALTRLALSTRMADYDVRTCLPLMRAAGFVEVDSGPTPYGWLTAVRGRAPRAHPDHDAQLFRAEEDAVPPAPSGLRGPTPGHQIRSAIFVRRP
jgi:demethylmenaquinone methyltransferase/2-methoxy-6-polyprenyl-1,4-benzoquinol methylase/phosphoethanolamine N-methyltransferase